MFYGIISRVDDEYAYLEQKNKFSVGDTITVMKPDFSNLTVKVLAIYDEETNKELTSCSHAKEKLKVKFDKKLEVLDVLRSND